MTLISLGTEFELLDMPLMQVFLAVLPRRFLTSRVAAFRADKDLSFIMGFGCKCQVATLLSGIQWYKVAATSEVFSDTIAATSGHLLCLPRTSCCSRSGLKQPCRCVCQRDTHWSLEHVLIWKSVCLLMGHTREVHLMMIQGLEFCTYCQDEMWTFCWSQMCLASFCGKWRSGIGRHTGCNNKILPRNYYF